MEKMSEEEVRTWSIDVGGTHTKAVAIDNATHEIIGKSSIRPPGTDKAGILLPPALIEAFKSAA